MKRTAMIILAGLAIAGTLTAVETAGKEVSQEILFLLEEEKMARDLYTALGEEWNLRVFTNIAKAEETHRSRMEDLAETYNLTYTTGVPGVFVNEELQSLYNELLAKGLTSAKDALEVGRMVEITDIEDIDVMIAGNPPEDVRLVLDRLRAGSESHLDAFERQLSRYPQ